MSASLRTELLPMLRIAGPVVMAELGWMAMGVVDTIMVGPLGPAAIGAAGVGTAMHLGFAIFGMGVLLGLDTLVSQAYGARDIKECHRWLFDGVTLAMLMTVPVMALCFLLLWALPSLGFHPDVLVLLRSYFAVILWSTPFLLGFAALRRYLQGMHIVAPIMFALVSANLMNAGANWVLIHGHYGFPRMGVAGSACATLISRIYMLSVLIVAVWWSTYAEATVDKLEWPRWRGWHADPSAEASAKAEALAEAGLWDVPRLIDGARLWILLRLGLPAASQVTAEVGVFALATALAGTLDPISSASHQIALNLAGVAFMIPLGLGSAGAVKVGHAVGAGDPARAAASGWMAIALGAAFMIASGSLFFAVPHVLIGWFTKDAAVLLVGTSLLRLAAVFQLFDGIQGVITGTLRGIGDTRTPMVVNLAAHWLLGLPVSYTLCFVLGWGVWGLWIGLSLGLIVTGVILLYVWTVKIAQYSAFAKATADKPAMYSQVPGLRPQDP
ncbi:MAG: MATE family efflux transporter [Acidobacteriota bacterium]|nr:MATE family efflux transporter [Acidobacteriota bacterium]